MQYLLTIICVLLLILVVVMSQVLRELRKTPAKLINTLKGLILNKITELELKVSKISNEIDKRE